MAQDMAKLSLSFKHNVKHQHVKVIDDLTDTLKKLNDLKIDEGTVENLKALGDALKSFKGITINKNLGEGISGLVSATNQISGVKDITPYAENMKKSFEVLNMATKSFQGIKAPKINANLGKGIEGLVDAANSITHIQDISPHAESLKQGFDILGDASASFNKVEGSIPKGLGDGIKGIVGAVNHIESVKDISMQADNLRTGFHVLGYVSRSFNETVGTIPKGLGDGIKGIVDAINYIENVKDISMQADNLRVGFDILSDAAMDFNRVEGTIPIGMGRGITGIVDAINQIAEVQDISDRAEVLKKSFMSISVAARYLNGLEGVDYTGISRLVTSLSQVGNVKKINDNVIKNAEKLAKAINILTKDVDASTPRLEELNKIVDNLGISFETSSKSSRRFGKSLTLINVAVTIRALRTVKRSLQNLISTAYGVVSAYGEVENTMSFFSQSLGMEAESTARVIQSYADTGAIEFSRFGDQVAKLNQIYRGYGIESKQAAEMALSLTQLAYDASFALGENGKDIELWFQRATSLSTGQARSGYFFGVDTSVQALQENFEDLTSSSVKADKVIATLNATLANTTEIQGQLGREYTSTYVQADVWRYKLEQLKQSIGKNLIPAFQGIIRFGIIAINVITMLLDSLSRLFGGQGFELISYEEMIQNVDTGVGGVADKSHDIAEGMRQATKRAKELKKTITGIDQVFTIDDTKPTEPTGGAGGAEVGGGGVPWGGGYNWDELLSQSGYMDELNKKSEEVYQKLKNIIPVVTGIGLAFAGWKIAKSLMNNLKWISDTKDIFGGLGLTKLTGITGILLFAEDLKKLKNSIKDFLEDPSLKTGVPVLSAFVGSLGSIFVMFGQTTFGGALKVAQGMTNLFLAIKDMVDNGISWENVYKALDSLTNVVIGIGLLNGEWEVVGAGIALQGMLSVIDEIKTNWEAIKKGDWSGVDKAALMIGVLQVVGGIAIAIGKFNDVAKPQEKKIKDAVPTTKNVSDATGGVSTKLVDLAKNLGLGLIIMAEVAAAALIFVGAIWLVGEGLQKIGKAWEPVIANGKNVVLGLTLGTALLVAVGGATYALGNIAIGGVGTVPLAIAAGTGMLVLLAGATKLFIASLTSVAKQLTKKLAPELDKLNKQMPTLNKGMKNFTKFMVEFAGQFVVYSGASAVAGIAATIDTVVGWFTRDPIKKMASDVKKNGTQFKNLNDQFAITNPRISRGITYMNSYESLLKDLVSGSQRAASIGAPTKISADFKTFSRDLKNAFDDLNKAKTQNVRNIASALGSLDLRKFRGIGTDAVKAMELGINNYKYNVRKSTNNLKSSLGFSGYSIGQDIARGVQNGINGWWPNTSTFTNRLKRGMQVSFTIKSPSRWARDVIGANIGEGVEVGINQYDPDFQSFRDNVENELDNIAMPTFDTRNITKGVKGMSNSLGAEVKGQFKYTNDGTERAIMNLTRVTEEKLNRVAQGVEDGKEIILDGEKVGESSDRYIKEKAIRRNTVFGR